MILTLAVVIIIDVMIYAVIDFLDKILSGESSNNHLDELRLYN